MLYVKNPPPWERLLRLSAGIARGVCRNGTWRLDGVGRHRGRHGHRANRCVRILPSLRAGWTPPR